MIITADDDSDASVVEAVKNSAKNAGAHAMVIFSAHTRGSGKSSRSGSSGRCVKRSTSLCRCMDRSSIISGFFIPHRLSVQRQRIKKCVTCAW